MTDPKRCVALVAHDHKKAELLDWAASHRERLVPHELVATGTTGRLIAERIGLDVRCLKSGPLGGDQQLGALIAEGGVDLLVFLWDPLAPQPHDPDVKALLRIAAVWNVPTAPNRATADLLIGRVDWASYDREVPDYAAHRERPLEAG